MYSVISVLMGTIVMYSLMDMEKEYNGLINQGQNFIILYNSLALTGKNINDDFYMAILKYVDESESLYTDINRKAGQYFLIVTIILVVSLMSYIFNMADLITICVLFLPYYVMKSIHLVYIESKYLYLTMSVGSIALSCKKDRDEDYASKIKTILKNKGFGHESK